MNPAMRKVDDNKNPVLRQVHWNHDIIILQQVLEFSSPSAHASTVWFRSHSVPVHRCETHAGVPERRHDVQTLFATSANTVQKEIDNLIVQPLAWSERPHILSRKRYVEGWCCANKLLLRLAAGEYLFHCGSLRARDPLTDAVRRQHYVFGSSLSTDFVHATRRHGHVIGLEPGPCVCLSQGDVVPSLILSQVQHHRLQSVPGWPRIGGVWTEVQQQVQLYWMIGPLTVCPPTPVCLSRDDNI